MDRYPCPCCGHLVFEQAPGNYDICPVCYWEDDAVQLRHPDMGGGANGPCLIEAQATYAEIGAMEARFTGNVREPEDDEPREPGWRPFDADTDKLDRSAPGTVPWPEDPTRLYWWRPTYWLRRPDDQPPA